MTTKETQINDLTSTPPIRFVPQQNLIISAIIIIMVIYNNNNNVRIMQVIIKWSIRDNKTDAN